MQRLFSAASSLLRAAPSCLHSFNLQNTIGFISNFSTIQRTSPSPLLSPVTPLMNFVCSMKMKGRLRRRCKDCYFVVRKERLYVMCPTHGRHKQMSIVKKPKNTWILTHASQSKVRPW